MLVESIIAVSIIVTGLLGVLRVLSYSLALNRDVGEKIIATYIAAEGVEAVKNIIDANYVNSSSWNNGLNDGDYEVSYDSGSLTPYSDNYLRIQNGIYSYAQEGEQTLFKRKIHIDNISPNEIRVVSTAAWPTKKGTVKIDLEDHFFNWR